MKKMLLIILGILALNAMPALAFHDDGVAHCNGCHTMHNSQEGVLVDPDSPLGNAWLLKDSTPSDTCLGCHSGFAPYSVLANDPASPTPERGAGDFSFLLLANIQDNSHDDPIGGEEAGHNIHAPGHGLAVELTPGSAPGGTFPSGVLGCTSCHDPHGTAAFRLLYGAGRTVQAGVATFLNAAPTAEGISLFGPPESNTHHNAYQGGYSAWCGNCHGEFHNDGTLGALIHPSGEAIGGTIAGIYDLYNGTSAIQGGAHATAYLAAVPFEDAANTTGSTAGPTASSQVSCVTCHRSHATSAPDATRWDPNVTFLHEDGVASTTYQIPDPYADLSQRSLCNKCHKKDEFDAPFVP